jgi:hypothetical protein
MSSADPRTALTAAFDLIRAQIDAFGDADAPAPAAEAVAPASATPMHEMPAAVDEAVADADDEAVLDLVAMEMAAPDAADDFDMAEPEFDQAHVVQANSVGPETVPPKVEPVAVVEQPAAMPSPPQPVAEPPREPSREASSELSLGSTIIASGILRKPNVPANDPLAPIRRMSQTEKIAFFS